MAKVWPVSDKSNVVPLAIDRLREINLSSSVAVPSRTAAFAFEQSDLGDQVGILTMETMKTCSVKERRIGEVSQISW